MEKFSRVILPIVAVALFTISSPTFAANTNTADKDTPNTTATSSATPINNIEACSPIMQQRIKYALQMAQKYPKSLIIICGSRNSLSLVSHMSPCSTIANHAKFNLRTQYTNLYNSCHMINIATS